MDKSITDESNDGAENDIGILVSHSRNYMNDYIMNEKVHSFFATKHQS